MNSSSPKEYPDRRTWRPLGLICLVALGFALGGNWLIDTLKQESIREHYCVLDTIARMKTDQLLTWRQERLADARMNSSGLIKSTTNEWLKTGNPVDLLNITTRMETFRENEGYHNMILTDTNGNILVSLIPRGNKDDDRGKNIQKHGILEPEEKALLSQVLTSRQPTLGDFYFCHTCNRIHINVAAPVMNQANLPVAILFLVTDPEQNLFSLLQAWPVSQGTPEPQTDPPFLNFPGPSYVAEQLAWPGVNVEEHGTSLLVRREKENVLFLTPSQYPPTPPLSLRLALTHSEHPAVRAVRGESGMSQGKDIYGEDILADIRAIPGTGWFLVTKVNLEKLFAKARFHGIGLLLLLAMAVGTTATLVRLVAVSRQKSLSEALLQAERARTHTQEEIRATLYGIGDGVMATDGNGQVTRMNPEAERLTGWKETEALGQPLETVFHAINEETEALVTLPIKKVLEEGESIGVAHSILVQTPAGHRTPVTDSWSPIRNEEGGITGVVLVFRDQTKRRIMEKARAESAKRYSDLVDSIHDCIWETGPDFCFTFVSRQATNMIGYRPEEIVGQFWDILLSRNEFHTKNTDLFIKTIAAKKPYHQHCQALISKDGRKVIFESSATPIFDKFNRFLGYRGVSRDITERRMAEEEQKKLQAQLLQAQKMDIVGRLAGGVAHDFNNMLTVICSYVEMSLNDLGEHHPLYKRLFEVHLAAQHSADLTRQLLAFARKQVISPRILDVNDAINRILKMLNRLIGENIQLIWNPGADLWPVQMDETQISQILANLVVNARDAIDGPGNLTIETSNIVIDQADCALNLDLTPGNFIVITVSDDGCGMDKETLSRIFEPFFTTKGEDKGTGLGLATVYGIVKQNQGLIDVASEPNQGTSFKIYLPQLPSGTEATPTDTNGALEQGTETLLLVEDEISILELGTYILEQRGYTVLTAPTPSKALAIAHDHQGVIDLLVTDVIMPEMNGKELAREIQAIRPEIKVLFISGYTADIISHHGGLEPGLQFLEKPFSAGRLGKKVREVIDQG